MLQNISQTKRLVVFGDGDPSSTNMNAHCATLCSNSGMRIFIVSRLLLAPVLIACQPIYRERNNPRPVLDHSQQPQATVWGNSMLTARAELPSCSPQTLSTHFRYQAVLSLQFCYNITQVTLRILKNMKKSFFGAGSLQPMICVPA